MNQALGTKLSDFAISSYTPSLTALINGLSVQTSTKPHILAVAQPLAQGQASLPGTKKEIALISRYANKIPVSQLLEAEATIENVTKALRECSLVHFACHGVQDTLNPTQSALLLAGHSRLTLAQIIALSLPHADLAFLSACQTATGAEDLSEEVVHLSAGMLLAGFRGVIGTMWSIMDSDAPIVAGSVYDSILKDGEPDCAKAAYALHQAVKELRETAKAPFLSWVPFIHIGV